MLGGILLDPDAIGRVADVLQPEAFYLNAHREIFRTALMLHGQGKPTDLTAMSAWLADTGALEKVGGNNRLVELVERVPSTASIEQVARLVMDKFLRRQLIRSGNEVIQLGFDQSLPMEQVLDQAEQKIFAISQEKPSKGLTPTAEILTQTFEEIESRSLGTSVAGIPVNFYDLDAMTQGLQRSDLIIVAGRPAMGKTSIVLNLAKNVAQLHDLPVCLFSLEMSKEQLTYRLLSMEVGIEAGRLRTGRLQQEEWPLLGQGINSLGQLPIFIDDKPNSGVLEMRSLCRRLMAEQGKELGLVMIDYLQLRRLGQPGAGAVAHHPGPEADGPGTERAGDCPLPAEPGCGGTHQQATDAERPAGIGLDRAGRRPGADDLPRRVLQPGNPRPRHHRSDRDQAPQRSGGHGEAAVRAAVHPLPQPGGLSQLR